MTEARTRAERKEQTRQALLDGTLELSSDRGFANVSLREIARSAGLVPTAFYRHFASLDELGLALVNDGIRALRLMLRDARKTSGTSSARQSLEVLSKHMLANPELFRFLYRERFSGSAVVRNAIESELTLIVRELTVDLARVPVTDEWDTDDLEMAADLIVSAMMNAMATYLAASPVDRDDVLARSGKQLRLILVGVTGWRPSRR
ncbi:TetR family transcriptional regulator [Antrihabitans sp. YC2-6]|uniref:TetR family transcriptional regulator n=1 Tax=Antrihabitans sp. YC2-6 TaxID=2799498 RepID=UPI0018F3E22C|nr:TetR family transcriptional regulator [Antrihabitans sp. YC2-6]MBJ8346740.1 TetR family transcriptional regulator [Antrihabitans sp. YC2-6]